MIERLHDIVIVGGGTAGWMTAAALAKVMGGTYDIRLVESDEIGIVGVGEATIPMIKLYNNALEIDEADFMRKTKGSFKLGIEFRDWGAIGDSYIHGFGKIGQDLGLLPFYQYWLKMHQAGKAGPLDDYSINTLACRHDRFMPARTDRPNSPLADIAYAYHFDAGLYARYLRRHAEARGVRRIEGKVASVEQRAEDGFGQRLTLVQEGSRKARATGILRLGLAAALAPALHEQHAQPALVEREHGDVDGHGRARIVLERAAEAIAIGRRRCVHARYFTHTCAMSEVGRRILFNELTQSRVNGTGGS